MKRIKSTKAALLVSVLSMVLCIAMLVGSTFAWFTDTATAGINSIQAGKLNVVLQKQVIAIGEGGTESETWQEVGADETLGWVTADGRDQEKVLWEPGCTYTLPTLKIVNKGNLALKYKVMISGVAGDNPLLKAIEFTVLENGATEAKPLADWGGVLLPSGAAATTDPNEVVGETKSFTISAHMKEDATNECQGKKLEGVGITVVATQYTYESDSNNNQYDEGAEIPTPVTSAEDLSNLLATGGDIVLAGGITSADGVQFSVTQDTAIDFNGNTLVGTIEGGSYLQNDSPVNLVLKDSKNDGTKWTIDGNVVSTGDGGYTQMAGVAAWKPTITVESGRYTHDNEVILCQLQTTDPDAVGVVVNGGTFEGKGEAHVVVNVIGTVVINGGTFNANTDSTTRNGGACFVLNWGSKNIPTKTIINDGTFSSDACMFYIVADANYTQKIEVKGGKFSVDDADGEFVVVDGGGSAEGILVITGGTFNRDPSAYVDTENYNVTKSGDWWTVTAK